jgi:hypothetical protein
MIDPNTTFVASSHVAAADLGGEAVILDAEAGRYFGLNEVAARILQLVSTPKSLADIESQLLEEYDVEPERLKTDLQVFVKELADRDLIEVNGDRAQ